MPVSITNQPFNVEAILDTFSNPATPSGTTWYYDGNISGSRVLTYSFSTNATASFRAIYYAALNEISKYVNISFVQIADEAQLLTVGSSFPHQFGSDTSADIRISQQTDGSRLGGYGGAYFYSLDSDLDIEDIDAVNQIWSENYYTILHELGHALTLKHTSPNQDPSLAPYLDAQYQNNNYTVMHYKIDDAQGTNIVVAADGEWDYRHFQLFDVYALQLRFGLNNATSGNTIISSNSLQPDQWLQVLWDAGGIDIIDMSDQTRDQRINLTQGGFSNLGAVAGNNPAGYNVSLGFGAVIENATGGSGNDTLYGNNVNNVLSGGAGNDILFGYDGDDTLDGGAGANVIAGGAGNDTIIVSSSGNELYGGTGNDIFYVVSRIDTIVEYSGEGIDEVRTAIPIYTLDSVPGVENLTFSDNTSHAGVGNALDNVITGGTGADSLSGGAGNDTLVGGSGANNELIGGTGNDTFIVSAAGDTIVEYAGEGTDTVLTSLAYYTLRTNVENLVYTGSGAFGGVGTAENNSITGGQGADTLSGLDGNDILLGGSGVDLLIGGNGADQFRYAGGESGYDRIIDFAPGSDRIALSGSGFAHTATIAYVSGGAPIASSANSTFLYNVNSGILSYDADGNGPGAAVQLAQLNTGLTLTVSDFLFY